MRILGAANPTCRLQGGRLGWRSQNPHWRDSHYTTTVDFGFQVLYVFQSLSVELLFWISIVSGIPDSLSCILDSKASISDSTSKNFTDSGIRIPLQGLNDWID